MVLILLEVLRPYSLVAAAAAHRCRALRRVNLFCLFVNENKVTFLIMSLFVYVTYSTEYSLDFTFLQI